MDLTAEQRASARAMVEKTCAKQGIPVAASPAQMRTIGDIILSSRRRQGADLPPSTAVVVECSTAEHDEARSRRAS